MSHGVDIAAFTDPEAYAFEAIKLAAGANVLGFGSAVGKTFHASLTRVSLDRLSIGLRTASASVTLNSGVPNAHVFMFATDPTAARRISGWTVSHKHIFHPRPNDLCCAIPPRQPGSAAVVTVPFDLLAAYGADVAGLEPSVPAHDDRLFLAPEPQRTRLVSLMNDVERLAREEPWVVQMPAPAKALAATITEALLACLTAGQQSRDRAAPGRHRQIVASLERALRERPEDMLSLSDLCTEVGVAQRTLNLACEEFLGQSAMRYARGRRLDHIRQCLLMSDPAATTVTEIAMRYGFWELGRFAQAYRVRFGEAPSKTLRRNATLAELRQTTDPVHARIA
ncbi:helix-turn-helix transcriptional regulator [Bradyrhizobium sp. GCM10027634]|uniref:helix-turn-helix transcriptional regulator n=1 Tax=unclassified Bradyrhizobium TaxID=2631580 RepID=UPI00188BD84B|nr:MULTISPECIES: AraC family transcriptional regulator [unclassified Bradyrhizobium]MDN5001492.1 helix-turn-helix transcriptional regulator [Bradyrhizobium sp. WYCCWR 12677]